VISPVPRTPIGQRPALRYYSTADWYLLRNVPHGPWSETTRFRQVQEDMKELRTTESPRTSPMFQSIMLDVLVELGWESRVGDRDIEDAVWRRMFDEGPWRRRGGK
jgi:hypothetical protein